MSERTGEQESPYEKFDSATTKVELLSAYLEISGRHYNPDRSLASWQRKTAARLLALGETDTAFEFTFLAERTLQVAASSDVAEQMSALPGKLEGVVDQAIRSGRESLSSKITDLEGIQRQFGYSFTQLQRDLDQISRGFNDAAHRLADALGRQRY